MDYFDRQRAFPATQASRSYQHFIKTFRHKYVK